MSKNPLLADKRKEEIVDIVFDILKLWLANPDKTLSWVLNKLNEYEPSNAKKPSIL
jgi:hypothetical protein